jgi:hypothetical protein
MLSGVAPFAIEQGLDRGRRGPETTTARVYNVNTRSRIDVTVQTPGRPRHLRRRRRASTACPARRRPSGSNFLDAWGSVTGSRVSHRPPHRRHRRRRGDLHRRRHAAWCWCARATSGVTGRESPEALDANAAPCSSGIEALRIEPPAAAMGLGDVRDQRGPQARDRQRRRRRPTPSPRATSRRASCHASHAVTGAIGVATAYALPGTVASAEQRLRAGRRHALAVLHPQGRIEIDVQVDGDGRGRAARRCEARRAGAHRAQDPPGRAARCPAYVFSRPPASPPLPGDKPVKTLIAPALVAAAALAGHLPASAQTAPYPTKTITIVVPTAAGGGNDAMARTCSAQKLGPLLGRPSSSTTAPAPTAIASEFVARASARRPHADVRLHRHACDEPGPAEAAL